MHRSLASSLYQLICVLLLAACSGVAPIASVRESQNLGVLAPFEGLYRRTGYAALESVRAVNTDPSAATRTAGDGWIPLALDTSRGAQRAAEKLLASSRTHAIVGPLHPADAFAVLPALQAAQRSGQVAWVIPFARTEQGFVALDDPDWLAALLAGAVDAMQELGNFDRIAIAGSEPFSTIISEAVARAAITVPVAIAGAPSDVQGETLLIWLGSADDGVRFISTVRERLPEIAVWLPQWAADAVLQEHAAVLEEWRWQGIYWGAWLPAGTAQPASGTPLDASQAQAVLLRKSTLVALRGSSQDSAEPEVWVLQTAPLSSLP